MKKSASLDQFSQEIPSSRIFSHVSHGFSQAAETVMTAPAAPMAGW